MLTTLKATIEGDKLHWQESPEDMATANQRVPVLATILNGNGEVMAEGNARRRVGALVELVTLNALSAIHNPVKWQHENREDRELPAVTSYA